MLMKPASEFHFLELTPSPQASEDQNQISIYSDQPLIKSQPSVSALEMEPNSEIN